MSTMTIRLNPGNLQSSEALVAWTERKVRTAMRRFVPRITRVEVHVADVNGPKGRGADLRCAMEVRITGRKPLVVEHRAADLYAAIAGASRKLRTAAGRALDRVKDRAHQSGRRAVRSVRRRLTPVEPLGAPSPAPEDGQGTVGPNERTLALASNGPLQLTDRGARRVIIAGFGPVGRRLADVLVKARVPVTIIDANERTVNTQEALGREIVHGDATDPGVLEAAGIRDAAALAITIPDGEATCRVSEVARSLSPEVFIAARTRHLSDALQAKQMGANVVTVEELVTAEALKVSVADALASPVASIREGAD